jgi:hypothetical protein
MNFFPLRVTRPLRSFAVLGIVTVSILSPMLTPSAHGATSERRAVSISASDTALTVPARLPSGYVDVTISATTSTKRTHHLAFFRRNDGVSAAKILSAPDDRFASLVTFIGGNGNLHPGETARLTLDIEPGNYTIADFGDGEPLIAETVAPGAAIRTAKPSDKGTVTIGPGMKFSVPKGFDGAGTWRFVNADKSMAHEAVMLRLGDGKTLQDVVVWGKNDTSPPPGEVIGGFGGLGPGRQGWMDLGKRKKAGRYVFVCLIPTGNGSTHLAMGMVTQVVIA